MLPYISVVTTSYNCEQYLEDTIKSVINQKCDSYKYIIIDAASTDGTVGVLERYKNELGRLVIEPDNGMYYGINKGAQYVDGEIMAWLNADDIYYPWTFSIVEEIFKKFPHVDWIIGLPSYINQKGQCTKLSSNAGTAYPNKYIRNGWFQPSFAGYLQQESMFWRKRLWDKTGGLNLNFKYAADFELWTRFAQHAELYSVTVPLASFRKRQGQTSTIRSDAYFKEVETVCNQLSPPPAIWSYLSGKSEFLRIISRLILWKNCKVITYSEFHNEWIIKKMFRPLSRYSISEVLLEWSKTKK